MGSSDNNLASMAIDGSAAFAKGRAFFGMIVGIIIGFGIFVLGIYVYSSEDKYGNNQIKGSVKDSLCKEDYTKKNKNSWDCSLNIQYNIDNTEYVKKDYAIQNSMKYYNPGNSIDLRYNTNNKNDITTDTWTNKTKAIIIIIISLFLIIGPVIWYYLVSKYKFLAVTDTAMFAMNNVFGFKRRY
jgi:hypothetical protein